MKLLAIVMVALAYANLGLTQDYKSPRLKTFAILKYDCAIYLRLSDETVQQYFDCFLPNMPNVQKFYHCILIDMNAWDNEFGIKDTVIRQYFKPNDTDSRYQNRTQNCLANKVATLPYCNIYERAYNSFKCYFNNFGTVVSEEQFVPYYDEDREEHVRQTFEIEGTSLCVLKAFVQGNIIDNSDFPSLLFNFVTRTGFYHPETGAHIKRGSVQFQNPAIDSCETRRCLDNVNARYSEEPIRAYQVFRQCISKYTSTLAVFQKVANNILNGVAFPVEDLVNNELF